MRARAERSLVRHLEGDPGQSEGLEVSLGSLHGAEDEAFLAGADVVQAVTVQRAHTGGRENEGENKVEKKRGDI